MDSRNKTAAPTINVRQDLTWGLVFIAIACLTAIWYWQLPLLVSLLAVSLYAAVAVCVLRFWPANQDFGPANRATLMRACLVIVLVSAAPFLGQLPPDNLEAQLWSYAVVALIALLMDGVDGALARAHNCQSEFGARFDMELDAVLILGLSIAVLALGKGGAWVLALGLMRYAFIAGAAVFPWLNAPLPESFRRKTVCVWQLVSLMVALLPPIPPMFASASLALALALLAWSFAVDIRWLHQRRFAHEF